MSALVAYTRAYVALELAPLGVPDTVENGLSRAERMLLPGGKRMPAGRRMEVAQQAWWGRIVIDVGMFDAR